MAVDELRATAREGHREEVAARYNKGRRSWKRAWQQAEAELERRGISA
jgi:hypothetical protein